MYDGAVDWPVNKEVQCVHPLWEKKHFLSFQLHSNTAVLHIII